MAGSLKSPPVIRVAHSIAEVRGAIAEERRAGRSIGLVPTMGALRPGRASLIEMAVRESGCAVVSIFVNPIQFNDPKDYNAYPRTMDADLSMCEELGARLIFAPSIEDMYPAQASTFIEVEGVSERLCGEFRP